MIEKVNPMHPDKIADRIAGALVDYAYTQEDNPRCAFEVLIGHGYCMIMGESSVELSEDITGIVHRIADIDEVTVYINVRQQDKHLSRNQNGSIKCGDNGIFKGVPVDEEVNKLSKWVREYYKLYPYDGKFILDHDRDLFVACQSNVGSDTLNKDFNATGIAKNIIVNPIGDWTGGIDVDSGATNRKLGSDMGRAVTGGGLHGKDLSKADVSVNIYAHLKAQELNKEVNLCCAIGDETVDGKPYAEIVEIAREYIKRIGGFEKFAEWGLV